MRIIAGPCQHESYAHSLKIASECKRVCDHHGFEYIFKASFDKANRSSMQGKRGVGLDTTMEDFIMLKDELKIKTLTDVHTQNEILKIAAYYDEAVDVLQIPAFLCRQTDLLLAAGKTGKTINIKKGQFLAPGKMAHAADKVASTGNKNILLTERGSSFGYGLVSDMTAIPAMQASGYPVVFDATHSAQVPSSEATTGGQREMIPTLAKAAVAAGCDGLFMEVHDNPAEAKSDAATQWPLDQLESLLVSLQKNHEAVSK